MMERCRHVPSWSCQQVDTFNIISTIDCVEFHPTLFIILVFFDFVLQDSQSCQSKDSSFHWDLSSKPCFNISRMSQRRNHNNQSASYKCNWLIEASMLICVQCSIALPSAFWALVPKMTFITIIISFVAISLASASSLPCLS